jgi:predicted transcriptional regulator
MPTKKWSEIRRSRLSPEAEREVDQQVQDDLLEMSLATLRGELGLTQVQVAKAAEMTQGMLSQAENRSDHLVSTVRRIVNALGGELEVSAVIGGKRVKLSV